MPIEINRAGGLFRRDLRVHFPGRWLIFFHCAVMFFVSLSRAYAGEKEIMSLARDYYGNIEYHSAITEIMRYQFLYPRGAYYPESMLLLGKSYYKGDNYGMAVQVLDSCFNSYRNLPEGEEALYLMGTIRLMSGSPFFSIKTFQEYRYIYRNGAYGEQSAMKMIYAYSLVSDLDVAMDEIKKYRAEFPSGKFAHEAGRLEKLITDEINRPQKSLLVSVAGSLALPGFGQFYTGNYRTGALSLLSNALLIFLAYDGYRDRNRGQMYFFGAMEFMFYQYSLAGAINGVREYNSKENFYKKVRLSIGTDF